MKSYPITPLLLGLLVVSNCSGPDDHNAKVLWLATDVVETRVHLIDAEPPPF